MKPTCLDDESIHLAQGTMQQTKWVLVFSTSLDKYGAYGLSGVCPRNREESYFDWHEIIW